MKWRGGVAVRTGELVVRIPDRMLMGGSSETDPRLFEVFAPAWWRLDRWAWWAMHRGARGFIEVYGMKIRVLETKVARSAHVPGPGASHRRGEEVERRGAQADREAKAVAGRAQTRFRNPGSGR